MSNQQEKKQGDVHRTLKSFLLSRKLWATMLSLGVLWIMYWKQIDYLYSFAAYPSEVSSFLVPAFITLTRDVMVCFTAIIGGYLGIQGLVQWKHGTESIVSQVTSSINEKIKEDQTITQKIEHVYVEGEPGSPQRKPFSLASEE